MRFRIRDLLYVTTVAALLLGFARVAPAAFLLGFVFANVLLVFCPVVIIFTTVVLADQRGQMLDLNTNPLYSTLKKLWLTSALCAGVVWCFLLGVFQLPF